MTFAPKQVYTSDSVETLADLRGHIACHPDAIYQEPDMQARQLGWPTLEVEVACEWLIQDGLEIQG